MSVRFIPRGNGQVVAKDPFGQTLRSNDLTNYAMTFRFKDKEVDQSQVEAQSPIRIDFGDEVKSYVDANNRVAEGYVGANNRVVEQYVDSSQELFRRAL